MCTWNNNKKMPYTIHTLYIHGQVVGWYVQHTHTHKYIYIYVRQCCCCCCCAARPQREIAQRVDSRGQQGGPRMKCAPKSTQNLFTSQSVGFCVLLQIEGARRIKIARHNHTVSGNPCVTCGDTKISSRRLRSAYLGQRPELRECLGEVLFLRVEVKVTDDKPLLLLLSYIWARKGFVRHSRGGGG